MHADLYFARAKNALKGTVLCVVQRCSSGGARRFGGKYHSVFSTESRSSKTPASARFLLSPLFSPENVGDMCPLNLPRSELHSVRTQKTVLYVVKQ
jgi:hypothetical protein